MKRNILVVDDEQEVTEALRLVLEENGYRVTVAYDGKEGLEKVRQELPDLLILDLMLPKIDGYKVAGLLKKDLRFNGIPILVFTAKADEGDRELAREAGVDAYLTKPLDAATLLEKVQELIRVPSEPR